jgi:hypothetical protein
LTWFQYLIPLRYEHHASQDTHAVFAKPVSVSLEWRRIEALLVAIGCQVIEGNGSRVRFEKDGVVAALHRPHPTTEAKPYQVRYARHYLESLGVRPWTQWSIKGLPPVSKIAKRMGALSAILSEFLM